MNFLSFATNQFFMRKVLVALFIFLLTSGIYYSQNTGIGNVNFTPQSILHTHINAASGNLIQMTNTSTGLLATDGMILYSTGVDYNLNNREAGYMSFSTSNLERMRILSGGNVGIGTTLPAYKLDVYGASGTSQLRLQSADGYVLIGPANTGWSHFTTDRPRYYFNTGGTFDSGNIGSYDENLSLQTSGTTRITALNTNGYVGVGTITPNVNLEVVGVTRSTSGFEVNSANVTLDNNYGLYWHGNADRSYSIYRESGAWASPYPDLCIAFHTGIKIGAHFTYGGTRFYNNSDMLTEIFSVGNGDNHVRIPNGSIVIASNNYVNFNTTQGFAGYGFRDNAGIIEYKHSGGVWEPFSQPPSIPGNTEWWVRPTAALYIQPMFNAFARVYDNGQTFGFYYEGNNPNGGFFHGGSAGAIGTRSASASLCGFTWDDYPFTDVGGDYTITAADQVTWSGLFGYGASYNGVTGIGELDCGVRGIGLGMSSSAGTNSGWPVVGVMGEVIQAPSSASYYGQQGVYGWQAAPPGAGNYDAGVLGRTSQSGARSGGVVGYYTSAVGDLTTCFTATNYGMLGTANYGGEISNGLRLYPGAAPSAQTGAMYYNSGTNIMYYYNGSAWTAFGGGGGDNLGNHTATNTLSMAGYSISNTPYVNITAGDGYGIQFWSSGNYAINMGNLGEFHYGPVWDYSIKMNMNSQAGRGWTWGVDGSTPVAGIECITGNMQIAGTYSAYVSNNVFQRTLRPIGYSDQFDAWGGAGVLISNQESEEGGFWANGNYACIFSPGDNDLVKFVDEDYFNNTGTVYETGLMARIDANGVYYQISDKNKKNNILKIENAVQKISKMNGYTYDFVLHPDEIKKGQNINHSAGIVAQEIENIFPEAVSKVDGNYMVNYSAIIPVLIEAIKEQQKQIEDLRELVKQLEKNK